VMSNHTEIRLSKVMELTRNWRIEEENEAMSHPKPVRKIVEYPC
jgi:hypothetical protein